MMRPLKPDTSLSSTNVTTKVAAVGHWVLTKADGTAKLYNLSPASNWDQVAGQETYIPAGHKLQGQFTKNGESA